MIVAVKTGEIALLMRPRSRKISALTPLPGMHTLIHTLHFLFNQARILNPVGIVTGLENSGPRFYINFNDLSGQANKELAAKISIHSTSLINRGMY